MSNLTHLPLTDLTPHPNNPRVGNVKAIEDSIRTNGLYKPLVVNAGNKTGRRFEILAGNHTYQALLNITPDALAPCYILDVDEQQANRIILADNRTSDLATYDEELLTSLLDTVDDLTGTGWDIDIPEPEEPVETPEPEDTYEGEYPYPGTSTITLHLLPPLKAQWEQHVAGFDTPEEALEYLLDWGSPHGR